MSSRLLRPLARQAGALPPSEPTDPYFSSVSLLLHGDGNLTDSSSAGRTLTAIGSAAASAAQKKFGSGSLAFTDVDDYITVPSAPALSLEDDTDFVVEAWIYPTTLRNNGYFVSKGIEGFREWGFSVTDDGGIAWYWSVNGDNLIFSDPDVIAENQWSHVAASYDGTTLRLYANGALVGSGYYSTPAGSGQVLNIGIFISFTGIEHYFSGYIDELRITKGSARGYTGSTIGVPTAPFPDA